MARAGKMMFSGLLLDSYRRTLEGMFCCKLCVGRKRVAADSHSESLHFFV